MKIKKTHSIQIFPRTIQSLKLPFHSLLSWRRYLKWSEILLVQVNSLELHHLDLLKEEAQLFMLVDG